MSHSIRLRCIDWLIGRLNDVRQNIAENLGRDNTHSVPAYNASPGFIAGVSNYAGETKINHAIDTVSLHDQIMKNNRRVFGLVEVMGGAKYRCCSPALENYLINHQPLSIGQSVDLIAAQKHLSLGRSIDLIGQLEPGWKPKSTDAA